jgi:flagellar biosynthetic protein FliQ
VGPDQTVQIFRELLIEAAILSAPLLLAAALISLLVSLAQTLTSIQEQTLTAVPRLLVVFSVAMMTLPWMIHRLVNYTLHLLSDLHRYIG